MVDWIEGIAGESGGKVGLARGEPAGQSFLPFVALRAGSGSTVFYHFVPKGFEANAFHDLLRKFSSGERVSPEDAPAPLPAAPDPMELRLFVSNDCPNCPKAVGALHDLCKQLPHLALHLFDATRDSDLAAAHGVRSVPTLLVGDSLRYVGDLPRERLAWLLAGRDPGALLQEEVRQSIQDGRALQAAEMIASRTGAAFLAVDLLKSSFQERIGLLLTLEEALEREEGCLDALVRKLLPGLESGDASLRGDLADLLGRIGHPEALSALRKLSQDENPDVAEIAAEAVESILSRKRPRTSSA